MTIALNDLTGKSLGWIQSKGAHLIDDVFSEGEIIAGGSQKSQGLFFFRKGFYSIDRSRCVYSFLNILF
ncbi:hypothetical protein AB751O23_BA_00070 [Chlamydiales bacterium SCGC AB-751-O23]|nr:hypothetical protein AB751O23_BA_00070 [Chlamydiales bacterium SCGC AB-751-O23]